LTAVHSASTTSADVKAQAGTRRVRSTASPKSNVTEPARDWSGDKTPFRVACATTAKIKITVAARRFPEADKMVSRDTHPRVKTIPAPNNPPPIKMERIGKSETIKR